MKQHTTGRAEAAEAECFSSIRTVPCVLWLKYYGSPLSEDWYHPLSESHGAELRNSGRKSNPELEKNVFSWNWGEAGL